MEIIVIPGRHTKLVQPLDACLNGLFKVQMCHFWKKWMSEENHAFTKSGRMCKATYSQVCQWMVDSWDKILKEMLQKSFMKAEITGGKADDYVAQSNLTSGMDRIFNDDANDADEDFMDIDECLKPEIFKLYHTVIPKMKTLMDFRM